MTSTLSFGVNVSSACVTPLEWGSKLRAGGFIGQPLASMPKSLPIACTLSAAQLAADRDTLLPGLADHAVERTPLPSGLRLRFRATAERLRQIDAVVRRERACCAFLEFRVGLPLGGSLTLDVSGPEGTASLLEELLGHSLAA